MYRKQAPSPRSSPKEPPEATPLDLSTVKPTHKPQDGRSLFGLVDAPVFRPTDEEFTDPIRYIEKIRPEAEHFGICKIVPPRSWRLKFALDSRTFRFKTRKQQVNAMDGNTRMKLNYLDGLLQFSEQRGQPIRQVPRVAGKPVDMYQLQKEVEDRGGFRKVDSERLWESVVYSLQTPEVGLKMPTLVPAIKNIYIQHILPYEVYLMKEHPETLNLDRKYDSEDDSCSSLSSDDEFGPSNDERKRRRSSRAKVSKPKKRPVNIKQPQINSANSGEHCEVCRSSVADDKILLCDGCNLGFHTYCIVPPLSNIPKGEWYCNKCLLVGDDFGFAEGKEYTLHEFQQFADDFKQSHFNRGLNVTGENEIKFHGVSECDVEKEFWRLAGDPYEHVEVEYGADIHSGATGSGFSVNPKDKFANHGWNLNNIATYQGSMLKLLNKDISGIIVPWLYVGMCFSTFCWHTEDHFTYSVNYLHMGDTKTWYGVPGADATKFEEAMREELVDLFQAQPDLLFHITTMISPQILLDHGVKVVTCHQRWGEFVVTFPRSYHAGFNQGFNVAEAVNFAPVDWLPFGRECEKLYQQFKKQPVFSHDELVYTLANGLTAKTAKWAVKDLKFMLETETLMRGAFIKQCPNSKCLYVDRNRHEAKACSSCKIFSYLSNVTCTQHPGSYSCLNHFKKMCHCPLPMKTLNIFVTENELAKLNNCARELVHKAESWEKSYAENTRNRVVPISHLKNNLLVANAIEHESEAIKDLKARLQRSLDWKARAEELLAPKKMTRLNSQVSKHSLKCFRELLAEGQSLKLDEELLVLLKETIQKIDDLRFKVSKALTKKDMRSEEAQELLLVSKSLCITDVQEFDELQNFIDIRQWEDRVTRAKQSLYMDDIEILFKEATALRVPKYNETFSELSSLHRDGVKWEAQARRLFEQKLIQKDSAKALVQKKETVPVRKELFRYFVELLQESEKLDNFMSRVQEARHQAYRLDDVIQMLQQVKKCKIQVDGLNLLQEKVKECEKWISDANRFKLGSLLERIKRITSYVREEDKGDVFCICFSRHEYGTMVACDICGQWYHSDCIHSNADRSSDVFHCSLCVPNGDMKPRLNFTNLIELVKQEAALPFLVEQKHHLTSIMEMLGSWQTKVICFLFNGHATNGKHYKDELRLYLRQCLGFSIQMDLLCLLHDKIKSLFPVLQSDLKLYCYCREPYNDELPMIACDRCDEWYHLHCVKVSLHQLPTIDSFVCPTCCRVRGISLVTSKGLPSAMKSSSDHVKQRRKPGRPRKSILI